MRARERNRSNLIKYWKQVHFLLIVIKLTVFPFEYCISFFYIRVISNGKWFWQINSHILKKYERPCKYLARWPVKANLLPESWLNTYDFGVLHWSTNRVTRRTDDPFPSDLATYVSTENSVASASLPSSLSMLEKLLAFFGIPTPT